MTASAVLEGGPGSRTERAFPGLDGARAIAATAVVGTHAGFWAGDYTPDNTGRALAQLNVGVTVFFVLSGFLLSRPLFLAAAQGRPGPRPAAYLWRRALRILPPYWLMVVGAFLLLPGRPPADAGSWLRHLTLTQVYGLGWLDGDLTHTWSLSTEVAFYLLLPLLAAGLIRVAGGPRWRPARLLGSLAVLAVLGVVWLTALWDARLSVAPFDLWLPAYAGWFGAGMAMAVLSVSAPGWRPVRLAGQLGSSLATCWAGAAVLFWLTCTPLVGTPGQGWTTAGQAAAANLLHLGTATLLVWPLVFGDQTAGWARRVLTSRPVVFLGEISYGMFLVHVPLLVAGYALLDRPTFTGDLVVVFTATWLAAAALGALSYVLVERPLRRWRHLVPDHDRGRSGPDSAPTATALSATSTST